MVDIIHTQVVEAKCLAMFDLLGSHLGPQSHPQIDGPHLLFH